MPGGIGSIATGQTPMANAGAQLATSLGTTVAVNAAANTMGSWVQLVASLPNDINGFDLMVENLPGFHGFLINIGIGAAAAEVVLIPQVSVCSVVSGSGHYLIHIPVALPAGTRISAQAQSSSGGSDTCAVSILYGDSALNDLQTFGAPINYGGDPTNSTGTVVDPGTTANTKGFFTQIAAATTVDIAVLQLMVDSLKSLMAGAFLLDIAIGAAGSEQVILPNIVVVNGTGPFNTTGGGTINQQLPLKRINIPAGTRLSARVQSTQTAAANRKLGLSFLGYPA